MTGWVVLNFIVFIYSNASQLTFFLLEPRPWLEESCELGLSFLQFWSFLGIASLVFSGTQHDARGPGGFVCNCRIFWKWRQCHKNEPKIRFFELMGNLVTIFFRIWSIMKNYIIKILFLRYGPKCSRPVRLKGF